MCGFFFETKNQLSILAVYIMQYFLSDQEEMITFVSLISVMISKEGDEAGLSFRAFL